MNKIHWRVWILACTCLSLAGIYLSAIESINKNSELLVLRHRVAIDNAEGFANRHSLTSRFGDCKPADGGIRCTATTLDKAPIAYRCDVQGCLLEVCK